MYLSNASSIFGVLVLCAVVTTFTVKKDAYTIYDRESWGSLEATNVRPLKTPASYVVIHHTYIPPACYTNEVCSEKMRAMQRYHMGLGYGDIGYNFCVGTEGSVYEGRGWHNVGIHAGHANNYSIGICLIGDWRVDLPPPEVLQTAKALIADGVDLNIISPEYKLIGHKQAMATECPGAALMEEISTWPHYQAGFINFTSIANNV